MLCEINILAILLFFKSSSVLPQKIPSIGYAQYQRSPPVANLLRQDDNVALLLPAHNVVSGENVQKLLPADEDNSVELGINNNGFEVPHKSPSRQPPKKIKDRNAVPENVHRVQEMTALLWPMGIVPYFIDKESYDTTTRKRIVKAMATIEAVSCVIFRELEVKPEENLGAWLHFTNPGQERDCQHQFGVVGGGSEVVLGFDCLRPEEILHSLLHALGFRDEVTHPQRDQYIRVMWDNIQPKHRDLFRIQYEDAAYKLVEYDPMSIMHFHDRAFTSNGAATIVALIPGLQITPTTSLSQLDIMRLKLAFSHECNKRNVGDLLDTCKNSLSQQKLSLDEIPQTSNEREPPNENNPEVGPNENNREDGPNENNPEDAPNENNPEDAPNENIKENEKESENEKSAEEANEEENKDNLGTPQLLSGKIALKKPKRGFAFKSVNQIGNIKG